MKRVVYMDAAREMFVDLAGEDQLHDCSMAIAIVITKAGEVVSQYSFAEDRPEPFTTVGALEDMQQHIRERFIEQR